MGREFSHASSGNLCFQGKDSHDSCKQRAARWKKLSANGTIAGIAMSSNMQIVRSGLWQWLQGTGLERFELLRSGEEWIMRGVILTLAETGAAEARYELACDEQWHTRRAHITLLDDRGERSLEIAVAGGCWFENGRVNKAVQDAFDIDLGWSPSTNTLPICRLRLGVGQSSGPLIAAWVQFPELTLQPLPQEYLRASDREYRYSSRNGAFIAGLTVDETGLVVNYEGFWRRVDERK